jgi:methyl-accepting chemotaxis protein
MGLRAKFNLVILAAFAVGFLVAAIVLHRVVDANARDQVLQNARIMMSGANAIRSYTTNNLVPLLPLEHDGKFVAETVPAFAAQTNLKQLQDTFPGFAYREAALNPTNLVDRAYDWEADIIHAFRDDPARPEIVTERDTATGPLLHLARPITVRTQACLTCHSSPAAAPAALTRTYGTTNGFGWKLNETVGAQILSIPMALPLKVARDAYVASLIIVALIFAVVFVVVNLLLHYLVVTPVRHVSAIAEKVSLGEENVESYVRPGRDEISTLSVSFNRMRESLKHAMEMLK